jgi:hypothetical protein
MFSAIWALKHAKPSIEAEPGQTNVRGQTMLSHFQNRLKFAICSMTASRMKG